MTLRNPMARLSAKRPESSFLLVVYGRACIGQLGKADTIEVSRAAF